MQQYQNVLQDKFGNVIVGASVAVYVYGTTTPATIYSGNGTGVLPSNTVTTNSLGEFAFYAANGRYSLSITATNFVAESYTDFILYDPADIGAVAASTVSFTPFGTIAATNVQNAIQEVVTDLSASSGSSLVGFLQSGTSAQATTVQAKLRETVSVKDFGAKGDGVTDDTTAIQAAIDYAKATALIKCVVFPTGNYKVSNTVEVHGNFNNGVEIRGEKATITSTANAPIFSINCRIPDSPPEVRINADIYGFVLTGPGKANTSSVALKVARGANVRARQMSLLNCYKGLYCFGNLISSYDNLYINGNAYGIDLSPDGIEFAPNDLHFTNCQVVNNDKCIRALDFPNAAMTFVGCELEGNNLSGTTTDSVRVIEFSNAGKVTLLGCHVEENPGQYNIYFDGNANAHLQIIGCEVIPGDSCGTVLYMANVTGASTLTVQGSRVTNNVQQIYLSSGIRAFIVGTFAGSLAGTLTDVVWLRDSRIALGRQDPLAGGTGIIFPATQNASTDPNTLDDYEEGTWTPTVIGMTTAGTATYAYQNGRYTKIGRQVFVECFVSWSAGTGTGDFAITGLPFVVNGSVGPYYPGAVIGRTNNLSWTAGSIPCANFDPGQSSIVFYQQPSGGGAISAIPYDAAAYVMVSGTYTVV